MGALGKAGVAVLGFNEVTDMLEAAKPETASYRVSAQTDYAVYVEFGTKKDAAQPYMRPATNQVMRNAGVYAEDADSTDEFVENVANAIADKAADRAPVDTGTLQDSITAEKI